MHAYFKLKLKLCMHFNRCTYLQMYGSTPLPTPPAGRPVHTHQKIKSPPAEDRASGFLLIISGLIAKRLLTGPRLAVAKTPDLISDLMIERLQPPNSRAGPSASGRATISINSASN